jgi:predicted nucleic acid-binding protein
VIAIDTRVLVRDVVGDAPVQSAEAARLLEGALTPENPGFVSLIVVAGLSWGLARVHHAPAETVR